MAKTIQLTRQLSPDVAGQRLDQALSQIFPEYSRTRLKEWLLSGHLRVIGKDMRPRDKVNGEETIFLEYQDESQTEWQAEALQLEIVFEDEHLLVIHKPVGLVVHPGAGHSQGTLVNALLYHVPELESIPRAGIIHRLDRETSGLLVVAKTLPSHFKLVKQLQRREIHREYRAIVHRAMTAGATIDAPIARHPTQRTRMAVVDDGKEAVTHYRVLERFPSHTFIKVMLETGRTHQIRVHMAHIQYPIVGDPLYGKRVVFPPHCLPELKDYLKTFRRQALHAYALEFNHPITGEPLNFCAEMPQDMQQLLELLRRDSLFQQEQRKKP